MAGKADGSVIFDTALDPSGVIADLGELAGGALKAAAAGLAAIGAYAVKVGSDFEAGVSQISATMGDGAHVAVEYMGQTMEAIQAIEQEAARLGAETAFSATQAAEGFNILAQSGLSAEDQISTMGHVLDLAAAGALSLEEAASFTTGTIKGFGDSFDNAQYYVDMMAKGATMANTDVRGLGEAMSDSAATAATYGQSAEETALALLRLAEQGETGSAAATALSAAMKNLYAPTDQARAAMAELGVSAFDPVTGKARDFNTVVDELSGALSGYSDEQRIAYAQTIFGIQGFNAFNKMAVTSTDKVEEFRAGLQTASDAMDGAGAAAQQAATMLDNLQGDLTILSSATEGFGNAIYKNVQGPLRDLVQEATEIMTDLKKAVEEEGLKGLAGAVGDALAKAVAKIAEYAPAVVQGAVDLVESFIGGIARSAPGIAKVAAEIGVILLDGILTIGNDLLVLAAQLITDLAEVLVAEAPRIFEVITSWATNLVEIIGDWLPDLIDAAINLITALAQGLMDSLPILIEQIMSWAPIIAETLIEGYGTYVEAITEIIVQIAGKLPELIGSILNALPALITSIAQGIMEQAPRIVTAGVQLLTSLVKDIPQIISTIVQALPPIITSITGTLLEMLPMLVDCGVELLVSLVQGLPDIIYQIVLVLPQIIAAIVETLAGMIPQIITCGIQLLTSLVAALPQIIVAIVAAIPSIIMAIVSAILDNIPLLIQTGIDLLTSLITALPDIIVAIVAAIPTIITAIIEAIVSNVGVIAQAGIQLLTSLITNLPQIISTVIQAIPQIIQAIVQAILGFKSQIVEAGSNLLSGMADGIGNAIGGVVARAREAASRVVSSVKSFFGIASPSKLFRDDVGKQLMAGEAEGIKKNATLAVKANEEAQEEVLDASYDAMAAQARNTVSAFQRGTGTAISSGSASSYYGGADDKAPQPGKDGGHPDYIVNVIKVDGRETARIITPYVAEELEWEDK